MSRAPLDELQDNEAEPSVLTFHLEASPDNVPLELAR